MKHFSTSDPNLNLADILTTVQIEPVILRQVTGVASGCSGYTFDF